MRTYSILIVGFSSSSQTEQIVYEAIRSLTCDDSKQQLEKESRHSLRFTSLLLSSVDETNPCEVLQNTLDSVNPHLILLLTGMPTAHGVELSRCAFRTDAEVEDQTTPAAYWTRLPLGHILQEFSGKVPATVIARMHHSLENELFYYILHYCDSTVNVLGGAISLPLLKQPDDFQTIGITRNQMKQAGYCILQQSLHYIDDMSVSSHLTVEQ